MGLYPITIEAEDKMFGTYTFTWADPTDGEDPVLWMVSGGGSETYALFSTREAAQEYADSKGKWEVNSEWDLFVNPLVLNRRERWYGDQLWVVAFEAKEKSSLSGGNFPQLWIWAIFLFRKDAEHYYKRCSSAMHSPTKGGVYKLGLSLSSGDTEIKPHSERIDRRDLE